MTHADRYKGKVAIVTGGASGIGEAVVRQLVAEGAAVVAADINTDRLSHLASELGEGCRAIPTDVTRVEEVKAMVDATVAAFGTLDVAFNVAGSARMGSILDISEEDWTFNIDLCLKGSFFCVKYEARQMAGTNTRGAIVNVASLNSQVPGWGMSGYCAAKAGLEMIGKSGSLELSEQRIRVNTVSPGLIRTPATSFMPKEMEDLFLERIPLERPGEAREIAEACLFLNSDDASYISGVNLFVDGGWANSAYPDMSGQYTRTPETLT
jgi:NAD(P)-dependent dehydrogenase (short-subunit alcohol dehydrogenase family)